MPDASRPFESAARHLHLVPDARDRFRPFPGTTWGQESFTVVGARVTVLFLSGDIDMCTDSPLSDALTRLANERTDSVIIDLTDVAFCSISGFASLLDTARTIENGGTHFALVAPSPQITRVWALVWPDVRITRHLTIAAAISAVRARRDNPPDSLDGPEPAPSGYRGGCPTGPLLAPVDSSPRSPVESHLQEVDAVDPQPPHSAQQPSAPPEPMSLSDLNAIARRLTAALPRGTRPRSEAVLHRLTEAAVASVPGADYAGLILFRDGRTHCGALCGPPIASIVDLENMLGEGPCTDTLTHETGGPVVVEDFATDARWPRLSPVAAAVGIHSILVLALGSFSTASGALALYGTRPRAFDEISHAAAATFAQAAAITLDGSTRVAELERAVQSRDVIGQAKGILIGRFGIDPDEAFEQLVETSQHANMKLVDVAHWLVADTVTTTSTTTTTRTSTTQTTTTRTTTRRSPNPDNDRH